MWGPVHYLLLPQSQDLESYLRLDDDSKIKYAYSHKRHKMDR